MVAREPALGKKATLFITCLDDQFYTKTLQNMTLLLERLGVELFFPPEQTRCGQPLFNNGFEDKTRAEGRSQVTVVHKANVLRQSCSLFCSVALKSHPNILTSA